MIGDHVTGSTPPPLAETTRGVWGAMLNGLFEEFRVKFNELADGVAQMIRTGSGGGGAVSSVNTRVGEITLTRDDVGLSNVDNTSDLNKPISLAVQAALNALQVGGLGGGGGMTVTDNGDGTFAAVGGDIVDAGDGSWLAVGAGTVDNGNGTFTVSTVTAATAPSTIVNNGDGTLTITV